MNRYKYTDGSELPHRKVNHFYVGSQWKLKKESPTSIKRAGRPQGLPPLMLLTKAAESGWWQVNDGAEYSRELIKAYYEPI